MARESLQGNEWSLPTLLLLAFKDNPAVAMSSPTPTFQFVLLRSGYNASDLKRRNPQATIGRVELTCPPPHPSLWLRNQHSFSSRAHSWTPAASPQQPSLLLLSNSLLRELSGCEGCERLVENGWGRHYNCHSDSIRQLTVWAIPYPHSGPCCPLMEQGRGTNGT